MNAQGSTACARSVSEVRPIAGVYVPGRRVRAVGAGVATAELAAGVEFELVVASDAVEQAQRRAHGNLGRIAGRDLPLQNEQAGVQAQAPAEWQAGVDEH